MSAQIEAGAAEAAAEPPAPAEPAAEAAAAPAAAATAAEPAAEDDATKALQFDRDIAAKSTQETKDNVARRAVAP